MPRGTPNAPPQPQTPPSSHTAAVAADAARARDQLGWLARRHHDRTPADRIQPDRTQPDRTQAVPGRVDVEAARTRLDQWATAWAPVIGQLDTTPTQPTQPAQPVSPEQPAPATATSTTATTMTGAGAPVAGASIDRVLEFAAQHPDRDGVQDALRDYAHTRALQAHPDHAARQATAQRAEDAARAAQVAHRELERDVAARTRPEDADAPQRIEQLNTQIAEAQQQATAARPLVNALLREKDAAIRRDPKRRKSEPPPRRDTWEDQQRRDRDDQRRGAEAAAQQRRSAADAAERHRRHQLETPSHSTPSRGVPR